MGEINPENLPGRPLNVSQMPGRMRAIAFIEDEDVIKKIRQADKSSNIWVYGLSEPQGWTRSKPARNTVGKCQTAAQSQRDTIK